jgi:hypothetical protein
MFAVFGSRRGGTSKRTPLAQACLDRGGDLIRRWMLRRLQIAEE